MPSASTLLDLPPVATSAVTPLRRRALLFFLSAQEAYRRPLFSQDEIFCGPDTAARREGGRIRAIRTD